MAHPGTSRRHSHSPPRSPRRFPNLATRAMAEPPVPEEIWEEILLRLPPDDPASLLRASLACKLWRRIVCRRGFLRRLAEIHREPPMLGFFKNTGCFVPTTAGGAFSLPAAAPDRRTWRDMLDCRHGRALLAHASVGELLVWEPITGYQRRVPFPKAGGGWDSFNAAVVCAVDGCDHWSCHWGPFRVVFVWASKGDEFEQAASAWEYSSETRAWGKPTTISITPNSTMRFKATILMGNSLYFLCGFFDIIRYDLGGQGQVAVIDKADATVNYGWDVCLMQAEDGGLGVAGVEDMSLQLWSRQMNSEDDVGWVLGRTINLKTLLPATALWKDAVDVIGFAEGANVIFLRTMDGIFTIEFKSGQARKVSTSIDASSLLPFLSFYAPGIQADAGHPIANKRGWNSLAH